MWITVLPTPQHHSGASLIELTVAILIFSLGVLGYAALQTMAMRAISANNQRDQVIWLTQDLTARMGLNNQQVAISAYITQLNDFSPTESVCDDLETAVSGCNTSSANTCTANTLASLDIQQLYCANAGELEWLTINLDEVESGNSQELTLTHTWTNRLSQQQSSYTQQFWP